MNVTYTFILNKLLKKLQFPSITRYIPSGLSLKQHSVALPTVPRCSLKNTLLFVFFEGYPKV